MRVCMETYGCTLNQADSDIIRALLIEGGHEMATEDGSDVIILNTCTVKGATENRIMERIKSLVRKNRKLVIAGCLAVNEQKIRKIAPSAPLVFPSSIARICDAVDAAMRSEPRAFRTHDPKEGLPKLLTKPIMRMPISEGCTSSCHFCQTRFARPFLRSYTPKTIVKWINESVSYGAKEIQLTSMDAGAYGLDIKTNLVSLMRLIESDDGPSNPQQKTNSGPAYLVRLGMINPNHAKRMLPGLIDALKNEKFYKFLHVPVQTGSEKVCREMNRDHTVKDFADIVSAVRKHIPDATIATDIIVGYPTETEDDFNQTKKLIETVQPDITNVSKFSPRPGTKAKELSQLHNSEIKRRSAEMSGIVKRISAERKKRFIGRGFRVLITEKQRDFTGRNINYAQVVVRGFGGGVGDFVNVKITGANHGSLFGERVKGARAGLEAIV